jgi:hypothetical protein
MASAAKAKVGALLINGQDAIPLLNTLIELGNPQPPTLIQTDNSKAAGFANHTMKQKRSKAMEDMLFYWIKDQVEQVSNILVPRIQKPRQFLHEAPFAQPPPPHAPRLFEPQANPKAQLRQCSARVCQFCLHLRPQQRAQTHPTTT